MNRIPESVIMTKEEHRKAHYWPHDKLMSLTEPKRSERGNPLVGLLIGVAISFPFWAALLYFIFK